MAIGKAKEELIQAAKQYNFEAPELWRTDEEEGIYYAGVVAIGTEDEPSNEVVYGEFACYESFHAYSDAIIEGRLGVGTDSPEIDLDVREEGRFPGDLAVNGAALASAGWYAPSDRRIKKQIEPLFGALDALLKLQGVNYA
jgi:hypothetical protein